MQSEETTERAGRADEGTNAPHSLIRSVAVFASGTFLSRVLGLVRDVAMAALIPQAARATFILAFRIPNTFRGLVAEGASQAAHVPIMSEYAAEDDKESLRNVLGSLKIATLCLVGALVVIAMVAAPHILKPVIWLEAISGGDGFTPDQMAAASVMLRWLFPYLLLVALANISVSGLNSINHFAAPALSPVLLNTSMILACVFLASRMPHPGYALVAGVLVGGVAQLLLQDGMLGVKGLWPSLRPRLWHPALGRMGLLLLPALVAHGVTEINALMDAFFAGSLGTGAVDGLYYANRLAQLPMGVFGVAIATTALPSLSKSFARNNVREGVETLNNAFALGLFFTIPAAFALMVFGYPMIRLLFEHTSSFDATATTNTFQPLVFYALGLASFAGAKTTVSAFYGLKRPRIPVTIAAICMTVNVILNALFVRSMAQSGLALATALSSMLNWTLLLIVLRRKVGPLGMNKLAGEGFKTVCAAAVATVAGWAALAVLRTMTGGPDPTSLIVRFWHVAVPLGVMGIVYAVGAKTLRVSALTGVITAMKRKRG
jgi:putative peptidoglycan lipid II flippase